MHDTYCHLLNFIYKIKSKLKKIIYIWKQKNTPSDYLPLNQACLSVRRFKTSLNFDLNGEVIKYDEKILMYTKKRENNDGMPGLKNETLCSSFPAAFKVDLKELWVWIPQSASKL